MPEAHAIAHIEGTVDDVAALRSPSTIRARAKALLERAETGDSPFFDVDRSKLASVADFVATHFKSTPSLSSAALHGRMRHFDAGGRPRTQQLSAQLAHLDASERAGALVDLIVPSVLLDAGAGCAWTFRDGDDVLARSEGIAVATLRMFTAGEFSSDGRSLRCDAAGLLALSLDSLGRAFQVSNDNPLLGLSGRLALLHELGHWLERSAGRDARPARLLQLARDASSSGQLKADAMLQIVLRELSDVWPPQVTVAGVNVGDVGVHPELGSGLASLVPFHKLSQWLTYSLVEPLQEGHVEITELERLTGLAEYRNGGLFTDLGLITLKQESLRERTHATRDPVIVEWRALTVALLDALRPLLQQRLRVPHAGPQPAGALEAATWSAGRAVAHQRRADGSSPLSIASDGTLF